MQNKKRSTCLMATLGFVALTLIPQIALSNDKSRQYKVTITNLTSGQPFTPPVLATHTRDVRIFRLATDSSAEIQAIAENGNNAPLVAALSSNEYVYDIVVGTAPLIPSGNPGAAPFESSASFHISSRGRARFLSIASMLICTNDGFTGVNSVRLPSKKRVVYAVAYDARSEQNTEDFADMVPPCQGLIGVSSDDQGVGASNPLLAESGFVIPHPGISGGADLQPGVHNWADPVARIVIERVRRNKY